MDTEPTLPPSLSFAMALLLLALAGCTGESSGLPAVGTLERDRIELVAEAQEPVLAIPVSEGSRVEAGDLVVVLDESRLAAQLASAFAARDSAAARLAELTRGSRGEEVDEARARLREAESAVDEAVPELERVRALVHQGIESHRALEHAEAALGETKGRRDAARSVLNRLLNGATVEELDQARANLAQARAVADEIQLRKERLSVTAPSSGVIDALPFEVGERPATGATVAVLLADRAPYARVYVPASLRPTVRPGAGALVSVEGVESSFSGRVRWISSEAAFTPYYALTERDRGRLSYLAEIDLTEPEASSLPTGLSVEVAFGQPNEPPVPHGDG